MVREKIKQAPRASTKSPKRLRNSIKKDAVDPAGYRLYKLPWSCDDCAHFDHEGERCTFGYNAVHHRRAQQEHDYNLSGQFALCRFQEID